MGEDQHPHYRYPSFKAVPVKDGGRRRVVVTPKHGPKKGLAF
jgi:hypothetical protein